MSKKVNRRYILTSLSLDNVPLTFFHSWPHDMLQYTECEALPSKGKSSIKMNKRSEDRKDEECQNSNGSYNT